MKPRAVAILIGFALLAGCSFQNKYEREADALTRAVANNDLRPVQNDISPGIHITRVQVAEWSDELDAQGKLVSLHETTADCPAGEHCFTVKFEKSTYFERMRLDDRDKITGWEFHAAPAASAR